MLTDNNVIQLLHVYLGETLRSHSRADKKIDSRDTRLRTKKLLRSHRQLKQDWNYEPPNIKAVEFASDTVSGGN